MFQSVSVHSCVEHPMVNFIILASTALSNEANSTTSADKVYAKIYQSFTKPKDKQDDQLPPAHFLFSCSGQDAFLKDATVFFSKYSVSPSCFLIFFSSIFRHLAKKCHISGQKVVFKDHNHLIRMLQKFCHVLVSC